MSKMLIAIIFICGVTLIGISISISNNSIEETILSFGISITLVAVANYFENFKL